MSNSILELKNLSGEQLLTRAGAVLPPWVALLLALAIAWQLARITWLLFPQGEALTAIPAAAGTTPAAAIESARPDYDISRIVGANLFGQRPLEADLAAVVDNFDELDETQLALTLRGTIAGNDEEVALAIIADDRGEEKVYAVGDTISGGRKLHSVLPDRAILDNNGELEALRLPREFESGPSTPNRRRGSSRVSPTQNRIARELQATLAQNPAKLTDLIRPQPVFSNGKQLGYRVYPGRRRQQFVALGLKPGDLVTEINGTRLDDPAKGAEIFQSLANSSQVTVTVERNGSPQVLVLDTEQLNLQGGQEN